LDEFIAAAIEEAETGKSEGRIPIGAILVYKD
jgi:tRNA(Arg) A34 adenosine deaminase TadA